MGYNFVTRSSSGWRLDSGWIPVRQSTYCCRLARRWVVSKVMRPIHSAGLRLVNTIRELVMQLLLKVGLCKPKSRIPKVVKLTACVGFGLCGIAFATYAYIRMQSPLGSALNGPVIAKILLTSAAGGLLVTVAALRIKEIAKERARRTPDPEGPVDKQKILQWVGEAIPGSSELEESQRVALGLYYHMLVYSDRDSPLSKVRDVASKIKKASVKITTGSDQMIELYNLYRVVELRPLAHDTLVIGCGHGFENHNHEGTDTLDFDMGVNPSVVASWGSEGHKVYFKNRRHQVVIDEGIIAAICQSEVGTGLPAYFESARNALVVGGGLVVKRLTGLKDIRPQCPSDFVHNECPREGSKPQQDKFTFQPASSGSV